MSEEVKTEDVPPAEILPAKSEDKLEIEKEEQEAKEKTEEEKGEEEEKKEEKDGETEVKDDEKKEEETKKETEETGEDGGGGGGKEKKRFKMPNVHVKVPDFLRSKSKERKKDKDAPAEGEEAKKGDEGVAPVASPESEDKSEKKDEVEGEGEGEEVAPAKNAATRVKEAIEGIHLPKISKPAFLKKNKKASTEEPAKEGEDVEEKKEEEEKKEGDGEEKEKENKEESEEKGKDEKEKENEGEEKVEKAEEEEKKTEEKEEETEEEHKKKTGLLDSLKSIKTQVFGHKKPSKDVTDGDKEESKELLDKKEEGEEGEEKKEGEEGEKEETEKKETPSKGSSLLESIRNVASQVPALFKSKEKEVDVEAGEKDELLDKEGKESSDSNKKEEDGDELEEVKIDKKDPETASQRSEKKDAEKNEDEKKEGSVFCKRIDLAKEQCVSQFNQLDQQKKFGLFGVIAGLLLLLLIIIICCATIPSGWGNKSKIVEGGKFVETHSTCGPVQGLVEGPDMFSFTGIPYAVPLKISDRWTHSKPMTNLAECHEGTFIAHSQNETGAASRCWRRYPSGSGNGTENCLTLDIYTPSVVYDQLLPVVVYVDGDDLSEEDDETIRPSAALAKNHSVVFVTINYRRDILGFLSLDALSKRAYPSTSGNYGLGDIIAALQWIKLNINHFGGHPQKVTLLGRGSGATLVTALTASTKAKDLFKRVWVTNGAGQFEDKSLEQANKENQAIVEALKCGADVADCLLDNAAEDLTRVVPYDWQDTRQRELPQVGEKGHSWIVIDKDILLEHPKAFWTNNKLSNNVPIVFGANAQGEVTSDNKEYMDWANSDTYAAHVESKLGSFNTTIPAQAMALYNYTEGNESRNHWIEFASMLSDIRTVCPIQHLAAYVSNNFVADIYSYVATQKRAERLGGIADKTSDISAIFGVYQPANSDEEAFVKNMQDLFFGYVKEGKLAHGNTDLTRGMYTVDKTITTQRNYPTCDFWQRAQDIVPNYGSMD